MLRVEDKAYILNDVVGYHPSNKGTNFLDTEDKSTRVSVKVLNTLGYIPVIGLISCIVKAILLSTGRIKIKSNLDRPDLLAQFKVQFITRGVIEALGLGFFYIGPDYFLTKIYAQGQKNPFQN